MENLTKNSNLIKWQEEYQYAKKEYDKVLKNIEDNEQAYFGTRKIKSSDGSDAAKQGSVVRKMCFELIETQADVVIPMPKVISIRGREDRATMIESVLRNQIDRLNMEQIADEQARLTPMLGSSFFYPEWDNSIRNSFGVGDISLQNVHPKQVIPQPGVYDLEKMDYTFLVFEQSKDYIKRVYGVDVNVESDENPVNPYEHMASHIFVYYRDEEGNIGLYSFVGDTEVQDYPNYFHRLEKTCTKCNKVKDPEKDKCSCGSTKFEYKIKEFEELEVDTKEIDPATGQEIVKKEKVKVKYYVPKFIPLVNRKNVSELYSVLGSADLDYVKDQQNDQNIYMNKIREKVLKGGSIVTIPKGYNLRADNEELKILELKSPADAGQITVQNIQADISKDLMLLDKNYEIGRQTLGITDSYQGRQDRTATSGKAKEVAIAQSAGRLETKKKSKELAYAKLYEYLFKFELAFVDETRPYVQEDSNGKLEYKWFDKKFFVEKDADGNFYYDDEFVFSVDESGTLANDRQAMWQETRSNFESGAYGNPQEMATLEMYWTTMNKLHYPCAPDALKLIATRKKEQEAMLKQQQEQEATAKAFADAQIPGLLNENAQKDQELNTLKNAQKQQQVQNDTAQIDAQLSQLGL